jgi:hypothetical protein
MCRRNWCAPLGGQHLPSEFGRHWRVASKDIPELVGSSFLAWSHCLIAAPTESRWESGVLSTGAQHAPGAGGRGLGWLANHVRDVTARMETVPARWCGETSIAWPAWPRRGKAAPSFEPRTGPDSTVARRTPELPWLLLDRQSLLWGDKTWGTFREVLSKVTHTGRLDLTVSGWIPLTYSLPDPGSPRPAWKNDAGFCNRARRYSYPARHDYSEVRWSTAQ